MTPKHVVTAAVSALIFAIGLGTSAAQRDLAAELTGRWEGTQQQLGAVRGGETANRERVLLVRSVKRSGEGWSVDASYGLPGEKLARFRGRSARLQETGEGVVLTLTYSSGTYVTLQLSQKDWLQGHHQPAQGGARDRAISLKRVSTRPTE